MQLLCCLRFFYRILKIDLEADSYEIIEQGNSDPLRELYQKESISACLKDVAERWIS